MISPYFIAIALVLIDLFCFYILRIIQSNQISFYWIIPIMIAYGFELLLILWALRNINLKSINLLWSVFSIIIFVLSSYLIYREKVNTLHVVAFFIGALSVILFIVSDLITQK
jgi:drug/metabolite transporter (DMT)-like permease